MPEAILPPDEPTFGRSCDAGGCDAESVGWRFFPFPAPGQWLPVCDADMEVKGVPRRYRIYDLDYPETDRA